MDAITFGILTISDTSHIDNSKDVSGPVAKSLVCDLSTETGALLKGNVVCQTIVPDNEHQIESTLSYWADVAHVNVILTTGGTGFSERDVTPEATKRLIDKDCPGLVLAMLNKSLEVTPMAMLSRLVCGIRKRTLIINLPGSPKAVRECLTAIYKTIPHAVALICSDESVINKDHKIIQKINEPPPLSLSTLSNYRELEIALSNVAKRLRDSPYPMISLDQASAAIVAESASWNKLRDTVKVEESYGRILESSIYSNYDLPPFRASIKDGYAVIANDGIGRRKVLGGLEAGQMPTSMRLTSGYCVRVNTGAPVPDDANAVVQVEDTRISSEAPADNKHETLIDILVAPTEGQDIRPIGSDIKKGDLIAKMGAKIGAAEMGIFAACGVTEVTVNRLPRVGILSTGNELQNPGEKLKPGHVYDSNKTTLMAILKSSGYNPIDLGIVTDDLKSMIDSIEKALSEIDVLITTGSVSMGDKDMLKPILKEIFKATIHFGRVNLKPGKPTTFATCFYRDAKKYFLCLPGNPVSATVTAHLFAIPLLNFLTGNVSKPTILYVELTTEYKLDPRHEFARVTLEWEEDSIYPKAYSTGNQISSRLLSCQNANALLMLPAKGLKTVLKPGDKVKAMLI